MAKNIRYQFRTQSFDAQVDPRLAENTSLVSWIGPAHTANTLLNKRIRRQIEKKEKKSNFNKAEDRRGVFGLHCLVFFPDLSDTSMVA